MYFKFFVAFLVSTVYCEEIKEIKYIDRDRVYKKLDKSTVKIFQSDDKNEMTFEVLSKDYVPFFIEIGDQKNVSLYEKRHFVKSITHYVKDGEKEIEIRNDVNFSGKDILTKIVVNILELENIGDRVIKFKVLKSSLFKKALNKNFKLYDLKGACYEFSPNDDLTNLVNGALLDDLTLSLKFTKNSENKPNSNDYEVRIYKYSSLGEELYGIPLFLKFGTDVLLQALTTVAIFGLAVMGVRYSLSKYF